MEQANVSSVVDWTKAKVTNTNPVGLMGVDFIEYAVNPTQAANYENLFVNMGFVQIAQHPIKNIKLYRQGDISFILNCESNTFASQFCSEHGPSICSTGCRVSDAEKAFETALKNGAKAFDGSQEKRGATPYLAIYGIGDSLIYFIDQKAHEDLYKNQFKLKEIVYPEGKGLKLVDHFTNNVPVGEMQKWCDFYEKTFNFKEARYFDIKGKSTGLISKVMKSPCGLFSVPINEPSDSKSQIQEYLEEYKGSGIQHLAMVTKDIVPTLEKLKTASIQFLSAPPDTYYSQLKTRLPQVNEDLGELKKNAILVDGDQEGYLLQIFTKNVVGPIFYEIIQRKGHQGFGEGNFQALFDAIEADQRERGYIQ